MSLAKFSGAQRMDPMMDVACSYDTSVLVIKLQVDPTTSAGITQKLDQALSINQVLIAEVLRA